VLYSVTEEAICPVLFVLYKLSRDSQVSIATSLWAGLRARDFSLLHNFQTGSGAHPGVKR
jgi:hypothetical protein